MPDRVLRSYRVVVSTPRLKHFSRIGEAHEPMLVEAFGPKWPIERFDKHIVCQLSVR